ncbi:MAG: lipid-A-disaccharide synthase [Cyclobacteriaceae bacterium]|nr:lipid-A-disaccharide synthase [Cyclobacteriaceae bacterium]
MKYYLIAGEASGDLHGSNLIYSLQKFDPQSICKGFGGDKMSDAGCEITLHIRELAIMGFTEVLLKLNKIKKNINLCKKDIREFKPDAIILIDFGGFNLKIAKYAQTLNIPVHFYISPKVWAWNTKRAYKIKNLVDKMYVILPFEKEFYKKFDWDVHYVGNPVMDSIAKFVPDSNFMNKHDLPPQYIALLPGSRKQELKKITPLFLDLIKSRSKDFFVIPAVSSLEKVEYSEYGKLENAKVIYDDSYNILNNATAAVVTSGTATLETACFNIPQVVVYKAGFLSYHIGKAVIKVNYISLVNLIADKPVVKELIQHDVEINTINRELSQLIDNEEYRNQMRQNYQFVMQVIGNQNASQTTAKLIVDSF